MLRFENFDDFSGKTTVAIYEGSKDSLRVGKYFHQSGLGWSKPDQVRDTYKTEESWRRVVIENITKLEKEENWNG